MLSGSTLDLYVAEIQSRRCSHTFMYESVTRSEQSQGGGGEGYMMLEDRLCVFLRDRSCS